MTEDQIKHMVDRFLGWKLPDNFSPDAGISFKADYNEHTAYPAKHVPSGTNLFDATQADAMVRYMIEGMPALSAPRVEPVADAETLRTVTIVIPSGYKDAAEFLNDCGFEETESVIEQCAKIVEASGARTYLSVKERLTDIATCIRALSAPRVEPVVWQHLNQEHILRFTPPDKVHADLYRPLYASPPSLEALVTALQSALLIAKQEWDFPGAHPHRAAVIRNMEAALAFAAPPSQPDTGVRRDNDAPDPCSDLTIGELIEWLDSPQYTNGFLDFSAANHMSAAAELLELLIPETLVDAGSRG